MLVGLIRHRRQNFDPLFCFFLHLEVVVCCPSLLTHTFQRATSLFLRRYQYYKARRQVEGVTKTNINHPPPRNLVVALAFLPRTHKVKNPTIRTDSSIGILGQNKRLCGRNELGEGEIEKKGGHKPCPCQPAIMSCDGRRSPLQ